jgi:hypothetical protein
MKNHTRETASYQVGVEVSGSAVSTTRYTGLLTLEQVWKQFEVSRLLAAAGIRYGSAVEAAAEMSFMLTVQPWVNASSICRVAQRFGGEPSKDALETDALLSRMLRRSYDQRTLSRFVTTQRYDWQAFNQERVSQLQCLPDFEPDPQGVIIVDDFPLPKPYAKAMDYLSPIWDNNLKRSVNGYAVVHLYYYHPRRPGYSLYAEPWLKTSSMGETRPKTARRSAQEGEERSKLDIALSGLKRMLSRFRMVEAVVFDSWYTARWFCAELTALDVAWIGEAKANQKFQIGDRCLTVPEIFYTYRPRMQRLKGFCKRIQAVSISATILPDRYTKRSQPVQLVLVTGLTKPRDQDKGYKLLVSNQLTWSDSRILRLFSYRFKIEAVHREGKQEAGWNDFHTRSLAALRCHLALALLRSTLLMLLRTWFPALDDYSLRQIVDHCLGQVAVLVLDDEQHQVHLFVCASCPALVSLGHLAPGDL